MFGGTKKNTQTVQQTIKVKKKHHHKIIPQTGLGPTTVQTGNRSSSSSSSSSEERRRANLVQHGTTVLPTTTTYTQPVGLHTATGTGTLGTTLGTEPYGTTGVYGTTGTYGTTTYQPTIIPHQTQGFTVPGQGLTMPHKTGTTTSYQTEPHQTTQKTGFVQKIKQKIYPHHQK